MSAAAAASTTTAAAAERRRWWRWVAGALIAVLLATAATSRRLPLFRAADNSCDCATSRKYTGIVEDCCCDYETVDLINEEVLNPILQDLVATPFFRYFKERDCYGSGDHCLVVEEDGFCCLLGDM